VPGADAEIFAKSALLWSGKGVLSARMICKSRCRRLAGT
jgi:hypothetical protein